VADALIQDVFTVPADAMTCGTPNVDNLFVSPFPNCAECLATPSEAGARTCCGENSNCATDSSCASILQCEVGCTMGPGQCGCTSVNAVGVSDFNTFAQCVTSICASVCPPLVSVIVGDL
jgi:hypothetical protein